MADVYTNDLRIREQEVGANSGAWGGYLNTSLSNLAESWSYGTEALADSAAQTLTLADGASDQLRSFYVKLTGTLSQATTVTIAPNTISKSWMIENATSGGYAVTISQGSGANVTVGNGNVKMIATDGAGAGAVVYDLFTDLELAGNASITTTDNTSNLTLISTDADANSGPVLELYRNSASPADSDIIGAIDYDGRNDNSQDVLYSRIIGLASDVSDGTEDGALYLQTIVAGTTRDRVSLLPTETIVNDGGIDLDFRVESDGNAKALVILGDKYGLGVGRDPENAYNGYTSIELGQQATLIANDAGDDTAYLVNAYLDASGNWKRKETGVAANFNLDGDQIKFFTAGSASADSTITFAQKLRIDSDGIKFGSDTAAANALDDYEEGTWTPVIQGTTQNGSMTSTTAYGKYTKVGNLVTANFYVGGTHNGNYTGQVLIHGFPVAVGDSGQPSPNCYTASYNVDNNGESLFGSGNPGTTYFLMYMTGTGTSWGALNWGTSTTGASGTTIYFTGTYQYRV